MSAPHDSAKPPASTHEQAADTPETEERTIRFSVSLPASLLAELDTRITHRGYASRSELVRDMIRDKLVDEQWTATQADQEVVGVLTIAYDHHQRELNQKILAVQHDHYVNVICATHVHLDHDHCLETIVCRGQASLIEQLVHQIEGLRGVKLARLTRAAQTALQA